MVADERGRRGGASSLGHDVCRRPAGDLRPPRRQPPACDLPSVYGVEPLREFTRMHLGQEPYLDQPEMLFASSGAEKG